MEIEVTEGERKALIKLVNREIRERRCHISLENLFEIQSKVKKLKEQV